MGIKTNQSGNSILIIVVAALVIVVIVLAGWRLWDNHKTKPIVSAKSTSLTSGAATAEQPISPGTDNASLNGDLNSVGLSLNQENSIANNANNALNDNKNEITVPTN